MANSGGETPVPSGAASGDARSHADGGNSSQGDHSPDRHHGPDRFEVQTNGRGEAAVLIDESLLSLDQVSLRRWQPRAALGPPEARRPDRVTQDPDGRARYRLPPLAFELSGLADGWYALEVRASASPVEDAIVLPEEISAWAHFRVDAGVARPVAPEIYEHALIPRVLGVDRYGKPVELTRMPRSDTPIDPSEPVSFAVQIPDNELMPRSVAGADESQEP